MLNQNLQFETKLKAELEELKSKSEKEYNQSVQQFTKELDLICVKHSKELEERVSENFIILF